jgi:hypothetical protein
VIRRIGILIGSTVALWLLLGLPARNFWHEAELVYSGVAAALCLVPTCATLAWSCWAWTQAPEMQMVAVLGGTGIRLFGVLAGAAALHSGVLYFRAHPGFWTWVLVFYLFTLALEIILLLSGRSPAEK